MSEGRRFSIHRLIKSFTFAGRGLVWVWKSEPNFRAHFVVALVAVALGFLLKISLLEWISVVFSIGIVMATEVLNSALEVLADAVHPDAHPLIGKAKDTSAGAVLLVALAAFVVGAIIFFPKLWQLITTLKLPNG